MAQPRSCAGASFRRAGHPRRPRAAPPRGRGAGDGSNPTKVRKRSQNRGKPEELLEATAPQDLACSMRAHNRPLGHFREAFRPAGRRGLLRWVTSRFRRDSATRIPGPSTYVILGGTNLKKPAIPQGLKQIAASVFVPLWGWTRAGRASLCAEVGQLWWRRFLNGRDRESRWRPTIRRRAASVRSGSSSRRRRSDQRRSRLGRVGVRREGEVSG
jgi:hypothetical protein